MNLKTDSSLSTEPQDIEFAGLRAQRARLGSEIEARIDRVLEHGRFILGPEVAELEGGLAEFAGCGHVIAVSSGTDALLMALMDWEIGPGDAVFVPAFTFTATAEVIALLGASPVFVDVDARSFNIDAADLERRLAEVEADGRLRPKAVLAVDLFGQPADYRALAALCETKGLNLLSDAAQSFGARLDGRPVGTLAPVTATSFFPAKPLGAYGDGGALMTDDGDLADRFRSIRAHGRGGAKYDIVRLGLNARLDTIQAAVLLAKLPHFPGELEARARLAATYDRELGALVTVPGRLEGAASAWAQYAIQLDERDRVAAELAERGVPTAVYYPRPLHLQPAYQDFGPGPGSLPVSEALCERVLCLPMNPYLGEVGAARVCDAVRGAVRR